VQARLLFQEGNGKAVKVKIRGFGRCGWRRMKSGEGMGLGELMYVVLES
jgi:hypothetical protein